MWTKELWTTAIRCDSTDDDLDPFYTSQISLPNQ